MATFGQIASPAPNVLFDPVRAQMQGQQMQNNALMLETRREDQDFQRENQRQAVFERDRGLAGQLAGSVLQLPPEQRQAAYTQGLAMYQKEGRLPHAPAAYPGDEHLQRLYSMTLTPAQMETRRTQEVERTGLAGMFGPAPGAAPSGGMPARLGGASPAAPGGGGALDVPAEMMPHFEAAARETGIPVAVLLAQAKQESNFGRVPSRVGDGQGVMQVLNSTARNPGYGMQGVDPASLQDPAANIRFGAQYLRARAGADVDFNDPAQRDRALRSYNGGGDPNYVQNVTRYLPSGAPAPQQQASAMPAPQPTPPGGVAARTGGTDTAGPGAGPSPAAPAGIAVNPPGTPSWAQGTTAEDQVRLRALAGSRGMTQEKLIDEASKMAQANRQQQRWEQAHPAADPNAGPMRGNAIEAQDENTLLTGDPASRGYFSAYARQSTKRVLPDGSEITPNMEAYEKPTFRGAGVSTSSTATEPTRMNADQGKVASFADRIFDALPQLEANEKALTNRWQQMRSGVPVIGNALVSSSFQQGSQAERAFINSTLRRESGAVISDSEFDSARKQYIPQPDDDEKVLAQKKDARERLLEGFQREAGPAYKPPARSGAKPGEVPAPPPAGSRPPLSSFGR